MGREAFYELIRESILFYGLLSGSLFFSKIRFLFIPFAKEIVFILYPLLVGYLIWEFFKIKRRLREFYFTVDFEQRMIIYKDNIGLDLKAKEYRVNFDDMKEIIVYREKMIKGYYGPKGSELLRISYKLTRHSELLEELGRIIPLKHKRRRWDNLTVVKFLVILFLLSAALAFYLFS